MASNGLIFQAKRGRCQICHRKRDTMYLKKIGEVRHGFACGYIWECKDLEECNQAANKKLNNLNTPEYIKESIKRALIKGPSVEYKYYS